MMPVSLFPVLFVLYVLYVLFILPFERSLSMSRKRLIFALVLLPTSLIRSAR